MHTCTYKRHWFYFPFIQKKISLSLKVAARLRWLRLAARAAGSEVTNRHFDDLNLQNLYEFNV